MQSRVIGLSSYSVFLINKTRNKLRKKHLKNVGSEETNIAASLIYSTIFSLLERAGDHIINVSEAMTGEEVE